MREASEGLASCTEVNWDVHREEARLPDVANLKRAPAMHAAKRRSISSSSSSPSVMCEGPTSLQELIDKNYAELRFLIEKEMKLQEMRLESYCKQINSTCLQLQDQSKQMKFLTCLLRKHSHKLFGSDGKAKSSTADCPAELSLCNQNFHENSFVQPPCMNETNAPPASDALATLSKSEDELSTAKNDVAVKAAGSAGTLYGKAILERERTDIAHPCETHKTWGNLRDVERAHKMPREWANLQDALNDVDATSRYHFLLEAKAKSADHYFKCANWIPAAEQPTHFLARVASSSTFSVCQTVLILFNTAFMGWEVDVQVKAALRQPREEPPGWFKTCNLSFTIIFAIELLFRMFALGWWFWTAPSDWAWNIFDVFLVTTSVVAELISGVNLSYIRLFRVTRVVQVARIVRVMRFFRNLRKMLFSILACLSSLAWAFLFLAVVIFMFSILFLNGVMNLLVDMDQKMENNDALRKELSKWFGSMGDAMLACLAAATGGDDWVNIKDPLSEAGELYSFAFVVYTLFVTMGVMNVLTGVFLSNADEFKDHDMIIQDQHVKSAAFVEQMFCLFQEFDIDSTGEVSWSEFKRAMSADKVRAYLMSMDLEPTHIRLIFDLLDEKETGTLTMTDFVMGMMKLKGTAKAIDSRILERELGMLPMVLKHLLKSVADDGRAKLELESV